MSCMVNLMCSIYSMYFQIYMTTFILWKMFSRMIMLLFFMQKKHTSISSFLKHQKQIFLSLLMPHDSFVWKRIIKLYSDYIDIFRNMFYVNNMQHHRFLYYNVASLNMQRCCFTQEKDLVHIIETKIKIN